MEIELYSNEKLLLTITDEQLRNGSTFTGIRDSKGKRPNKYKIINKCTDYAIKEYLAYSLFHAFTANTDLEELRLLIKDCNKELE